MRFICSVKLDGFKEELIVCVLAATQKDAEGAAFDMYTTQNFLVTEVQAWHVTNFPTLYNVINAIS
jgi:hypothetical protein